MHPIDWRLGVATVLPALATKQPRRHYVARTTRFSGKLAESLLDERLRVREFSAARERGRQGTRRLRPDGWFVQPAREVVGSREQLAGLCSLVQGPVLPTDRNQQFHVIRVGTMLSFEDVLCLREQFIDREG